MICRIYFNLIHENQQNHQINFSVLKILGSKTMRFYKLLPTETVVNEKNLELQQTLGKIYFTIYLTSLYLFNFPFKHNMWIKGKSINKNLC